MIPGRYNMKTSYSIAAIISIIIIGLHVFAATEQWRYQSPHEITQIMTDGKGGCAVVVADTNGVSQVIWLDKKGQVLYTSLPAPGFPIGAINSCTPKQLVYTLLLGPPMLVQVTKTGQEIPVASIGGFLYGRPLTYGSANELSDKKGFFVINVETNTMRKTLVRYSYK
jgi:hypothetical protein